MDEFVIFKEDDYGLEAYVDHGVMRIKVDSGYDEMTDRYASAYVYLTRDESRQLAEFLLNYANGE